jgi:hypothetical protein
MSPEADGLVCGECGLQMVVQRKGKKLELKTVTGLDRCKRLLRQTAPHVIDIGKQVAVAVIVIWIGRWIEKGQKK